MTVASITIGRSSPWPAGTSSSRPTNFCQPTSSAERSAAPRASITPPAGLLLVATLREETVGCGALTFQDDGFAEVKRVWAAPSVRGLGLGRRLMADLEDRARAAGVRALRLDTNGALTEAIALYRKLGYREIERYNDNPYAQHWFTKEL